MNALLKTAVAAAVITVAAHASAQVTFYEQDGFQGRSFTTQQEVRNFQRYGFNDRASSVNVVGERWEVCDDTRFQGRCVVLRPGQYPSLAAMGLSDRISSVRAIPRNARVDDRRYAPVPVASSQVTFYEAEGFGGRSFTTTQLVDNFQNNGFNDLASSILVTGQDQWEICDDVRFKGRCVVLRPGQYPSLGAMGLNNRVSSVRVVDRNERVDDRRYGPAPVVPQVTFYEMEGFGGRSFTTTQPVDNFQRNGFNDLASSVVVIGDRWEVCDDARFGGRCMVLRPGQYPSLAAMGLNNRVSSVRAVDGDARIDDRRYGPASLMAPPQPAADFRRRNNERLYEANVTSVRAVLGTPEQRCWVEPQQVPQNQTNANVPGAIIGALLGGVLGHQVGGGTGKDLATAGGVIAGAVIGNNMGGNATPAPPQNVQRCENLPIQAQPQYWDVTYNFRGQEHRMQMSSPPGPTVTVNEQGEPRK